MTKIKKILFLTISIFIIFFTLTFNAGATGIAVSPSKIEITQALKGNEYNKSFLVFNTDNYEDTYNISIEGEMSDWITLYHPENRDIPITNITIPAKDKSYVIFRIVPPVDTANGLYTSKIYVQSIPPESTGGQAGVILRMPIDIKLNVTGTQVIDGVYKGTIIDIIEPGYPLIIKTRFQNTGNVIVTPKIDFSIIYDNEIIHHFIHDSTEFKPQELKYAIAEWQTNAANPPGNYFVNFTLSLEGRTLASDSIPFEILPVGTLSRKGELIGLSIEGEPAPETMVKVNAIFKNTGQISSSAKFVGEIYNNDNLIDKISSEELNVEPHEEVILVSYMKIGSPGDYLIQGKAIYSGKETPVKDLTINVPNNKLIPGFEGISLIAVMLLLVMIRGKKKSRKM